MREAWSSSRSLKAINTHSVGKGELSLHYWRVCVEVLQQAGLYIHTAPIIKMMALVSADVLKVCSLLPSILLIQ